MSLLGVMIVLPAALDLGRGARAVQAVATSIRASCVASGSAPRARRRAALRATGAAACAGAARLTCLTTASATSGQRSPRARAERLAELDEARARGRSARHERPEPPRPRAATVGRRASAALIVIVAAGHQLVPRSGDVGLRGLPGTRAARVRGAAGRPARSTATRTSSRPASDESADNDTPACDVREAGCVEHLRAEEKGRSCSRSSSCRAAKCEPQLDRIERLQRRVPDVQFVGVVVGRGPREGARRLVREARLELPGGRRPRRRALQPLPRRRLPDHRLRRRGRQGAYGTRLGNLSERELAGAIRRIARWLTRTLEAGWVAPDLAAEFPQLALTWCLIERRLGRARPRRSRSACAR